MIPGLETGLPIEMERNIYLISFIISTAFTVFAYVLKALAIKAMAKNKGLDKLWLAWIPFFNYILLGKVIGVSYMFRKKVNNIGLFVAILSCASFVLSNLLSLGYYVNELSEFFGFRIYYESVFIEEWMYQQGVFYTVVYYVYDVLALVEIVFSCTMIYFIFRKFAPERSLAYSVISVFFDFMFGILLFVIRNRKPSTYDEFLRTRVRSGYNTYENSYHQYGKNPESNPFPEFDDGNRNVGAPSKADDTNASSEEKSEVDELFK